jgi:hypothetical protein
MKNYLSRANVSALLFALCGALAAGCAGNGAAEGADPSNEVASDDLTGSHAVGTAYVTLDDVNMRSGPGLEHDVLGVVPRGTRVVSASAEPRNGWYGVTAAAGTGWIRGDFLRLESSGGGGGGAGNVSAKGKAQMQSIIEYGKSHNSGVSGGRCFEFVWRYISESGYGLIDEFGDASDMPSAFARNFAEYMNANGNAARWGLQRLSITNPYDAPAGAIVVVAPGTPGTSHPTAGDISIATGGSCFINDGPCMTYGGRDGFTNGGKVLGVYVPQ